MTRQEALEKLGGRRGTVIGTAVGCGAVLLGLLLACGLMFGWVGNTVSGMVEDNRQAAEYTVADEWGLAGKATRSEAAGGCVAGQEATGTVYGDGSWAGWQCVEVRQ